MPPFTGGGERQQGVLIALWESAKIEVQAEVAELADALS